MPSLDHSCLCKALRGGRFEWRSHALRRMMERGIRQDDVLRVLLTGERIEDYPNDMPYPSALFLAEIADRPIHVVAAYDAEHDWGYVITAYEPDSSHFEPDWRTRKNGDISHGAPAR